MEKWSGPVFGKEKSLVPIGLHQKLMSRKNLLTQHHNPDMMMDMEILEPMTLTCPECHHPHITTRENVEAGGGLGTRIGEMCSPCLDEASEKFEWYCRGGLT